MKQVMGKDMVHGGIYDFYNSNKADKDFYIVINTLMYTYTGKSEGYPIESDLAYTCTYEGNLFEVFKVIGGK